MLADPPNLLRDARERVSKAIALAKDGSVVIRNAEFSARQKVLAYFVGKAYSAVVGFASSPIVENRELVAKLGMPDGTVKPCVKELRDARLIDAVENGRHQLALTALERTLTELGV